MFLGQNKEANTFLIYNSTFDEYVAFSSTKECKKEGIFGAQSKIAGQESRLS